jgi:ubiquinone/menaquinone biosynthesis C-methylase UbiE
MKKQKKLVYVFDDDWKSLSKVFDRVRDVVNKRLNENQAEYEIEFTGLSWDRNEDAVSQVAAAADKVLGVTDGDISVDAILCDVVFDSAKSPYQCFELLIGGEQQTLVDELVGSGLPTIIFTQSKALEHVYRAGKEELPLVFKDPLETEDFETFGETLARHLQQQFSHLRYNEMTLRVANKYAEVYDEKELGSVATRIVIMWENERVLTMIKEVHNRLGHRLKILDIGCGTGRFEELLLLHSDTADLVEQIVAVDFAPMHFVQARDRLHALGLSEELQSRVNYKRRVAEDLRMPSDTYDVVLMAFGVPCFSDYRRSLPEAARVLVPNGMITFTGYNYDSLNFEYEEDFSQKLSGGRRSFFSADIDRSKNEMTLPNCNPFPCHTFTPKQFLEIIRQDFFVVDEADVRQRESYRPMETFPIIHGCAPKEFIERLVHMSDEWKIPSPTSYMNAELRKWPGSSEELYRMDRELSQLSALRDRGHYINVIATKKKSG